jgi:hypothetical protein
MSKLDKTCPSSSIKLGANLLGALNNDGIIGFISGPIPVNEEILETLREVAEPEKKFRFSNTCIEKGCNQWQNGGCSVIVKVMNQNEDFVVGEKLPDCSIRSSCRWYYQDGGKACGFCPHIFTNMLSHIEARETV